ncbi:PD-(D/E)XK motif protein [Terracoccus sp. 273MFTsu3.1]|uniref:PD-(D/E)XK motif protein n=1 Tax=Terracoccus sp. 273MFTsu3.1 TaxID=1172188 RepID=UPI000361D590|nr:PD-(D/E)XK motif protein [Terracoccus sp. 273MFTsu3.1]
MQTDDVEVQWARLCSDRSPAKKYFDPSHPLNLLFGADEKGRAVMVLITAQDPELEDLSRDVTTSSSRREDGRWATTWTLVDQSLFPTFVRLGVDLAERSAVPRAGLAPIDQFLLALAQWQVLFRPHPPKRLTLERLRGLVAELWAGETVVSQGRSRAEIVRSWSGPLGGVQDFTFPSGHVWEVKAKRSKATTVKVSSVEQLDPADKTLHLVVFDLDERSIDSPGARSLVDLVQSWRAALGVNPAERHLFDLLVSRLGVDLSDHYYSEMCFTLQNATVFRVNSHFPSLRSHDMPSPVSSVRYQLDVRGLEAWMVDGGMNRE